MNDIRPRWLLALSLCAVPLVACGGASDEGSGSEEPGPEGPGPEKPGPGQNAYDQEYAKCGLETGFDSDELCILPPDPSVGFQLHYGPSDYDDPEEVARFTLAEGELDDVLPVVSGNERDILFSEYHVRMRSGTHHMILWDGGAETTVAPGLSRFLIGAQSALGPDGGRLDVPEGEVAEENRGLAQRLGAGSNIGFNMHYVNATTEPLLREAWINFHYADEDKVEAIMDPITFYGGLGMAIQPHSQEVVKATCEYGGTGDPLRVIALSAHMHSHGHRFTAHKISPTAAGKEERTLVYETYNWSEPENMQYDSITKNPAPNGEMGLGGGFTGELLVNPGDRIEYECEFHNDDDIVLRFANEAYTAEMCNLFGYYTPSVGGPWSCWNF